MTKNEKLIEKLTEEHKSLLNKNARNEHDINDFNFAIEYLTSGKILVEESKLFRYDLLDACVNDLPTMYSDYEVE